MNLRDVCTDVFFFFYINLNLTIVLRAFVLSSLLYNSYLYTLHVGRCTPPYIEDSVAVGLILVGSSPGGSTSNLFTYWSRGNLSLSVVMSAASTLAALGFMPLCAFLYAKLAYDAEVEVVVQA